MHQLESPTVEPVAFPIWLPILVKPLLLTPPPMLLNMETNCPADGRYQPLVVAGAGTLALCVTQVLLNAGKLALFAVHSASAINCWQ